MKKMMLLVVCLYASLQVAGAEDTPALRLITEENMPINYRDRETGEITGAAHDMVMALMEKAGVPYTVELLPWQRGYRLALESENSCIYGINRTHDREELFSWVGPLMQSSWAFYSYDQSLELDDLTSIRDQMVVAKAGDAISIALRAARPDISLITVETDVMAVRLLAHGRAQLWLTGIVNAPRNAEEAGVDLPDRKLLWRKSVIYMGCSKKTDPKVIERLKAAMPLLEDQRAQVLKRYWD
ncbi:MAG: transporter substrate-binding domain-containing protein [Alphaproteobacteria bacterium]|nr:transporter substrate-binding domain-containing protein [Alphaproteobacteria bacterium]